MMLSLSERRLLLYAMTHKNKVIVYGVPSRTIAEDKCSRILAYVAAWGGAYHVLIPPVTPTQFTLANGTKVICCWEEEQVIGTIIHDEIIDDAVLNKLRAVLLARKQRKGRKEGNDE